MLNKKISSLEILENKIKAIQNSGILPEDLSILNETQTEILNYINNTNLSPLDIIDTFLDYTNTETKQRLLYRRLKKRGYSRGLFVDLKPEDIIINEYCPFLGLKINFNLQKDNIYIKNGCSIDRINNELVYKKGNVWVISRLANTMKNDASLSELKTFCINILKQYENNTHN